jgi:hypothetical protein
MGHANYLLLHNCRFVVREKGRQKVILNKRKNVHAFVRGDLKTGYGNWLGLASPLRATASEFLTMGLDGWVQLTYNPYHNKTFVVKTTNVPVITARMVLIRENKVYARL